MKKPPIMLMIDHNITDNFLMPTHNYKKRGNPLGEPSFLIFHSGTAATFLSSDLKKKSNIHVRTIDIVMKFNRFIQKSCD